MRTITIIEHDDGTVEVLRDDRYVQGRSFPTHNEYYLTNHTVIIGRSDSESAAAELPPGYDSDEVAQRVAANVKFLEGSTCSLPQANCH